MTEQRAVSNRSAQLIHLEKRRSELDRAIRLLEEIRLIRLRRPPELNAIISKVRRVT